MMISDSLLHDCAHAEALAQLLAQDNTDTALQAGLMVFTPCPQCPQQASLRVGEGQRRLNTAWAARARYQARAQRLQRIAAERDARRAPVVIEKKPALPPAAAAILARAKAKAAGKTSP